MQKQKTKFAHALDYLRANGLITNQKALAELIGTTETTISRNKRGNVRRLDEDTLQRFNAAFGHIINIAYLRGESSTMLVNDLSPQDANYTGVHSSARHVSTPDGNNAPDMSSLINAALAAKDETIMSLRREITAKDDIIKSLHEQLANRTTLLQTTQQYATDIATKYEELLQEHHTLLRRINVNIEHFQDSHLNIHAAEADPSYH